jgi:hypothetical protein
MKKIGFVDYYVSEWHANNYPAWIAEECAKAGLDYALSYVWAEREISPVDGRSTAEWCREFGAEPCATLEELCEKSDVIVLLAPSNPEKHLPYAKTVLSYGKPTYIDKTFAPSLSEAKEIFALAEQYGTPFFSSSALRYEKGLDATEDCRHITVFQSGSSCNEYVIHAIEMVVKTLGTGALPQATMANDICVWHFVVHNLPEHASYSVEVASRPAVTLPLKDLQDKNWTTQFSAITKKP